MKILFYHNSNFWDPHCGVLLDEAERMHHEGHEVIFATCGRAVRHCMMNMRGDALRCRLCKWQMNHALRHNLSTGIKIAYLADYTKDIIAQGFAIKSISDIKAIDYKGVKIGYGALSSYISCTRNLDPLFDKDFISYMSKLLDECAQSVDGFDNMLNDFNPDTVCIFNGRMMENRSLYELCINRNVQLVSYEVTGGFGGEYYKVEFNNSLPHGIDANAKMIDQIWNDSSVNIEEKIKIGTSFFENRKNAVPAGDKVYIRAQQIGKLPNNWDGNKRNFAIFNSSEDEFASIGEELERLNLFSSQLEGIKKMLLICQCDNSIHFYLRIHPNLNGIHYRYHTELYDLENEFSNITVISGNSSVSSYTLMDACEKIIVFGSTMGVESSYWNKPVILLSGCLYYPLNLCYTPKDIKELEKMLFSHIHSIVGAKEKAIKWGYRYMNRQAKNKFLVVDFNCKEFTVLGGRFKIANYQRLFGSARLFFLYSVASSIILRLLYGKYPKGIPTKERPCS